MSIEVLQNEGEIDNIAYTLEGKGYTNLVPATTFITVEPIEIFYDRFRITRNTLSSLLLEERHFPRINVSKDKSEYSIDNSPISLVEGRLVVPEDIYGEDDCHFLSFMRVMKGQNGGRIQKHRFMLAYNMLISRTNIKLEQKGYDLFPPLK